jgi:hypothetical protein
VSVREASEDELIEKAEFVYRCRFMGMEHNYLCAVCREDSAIINCNTGILQPCSVCQERRHYRVIRLNWFDRLLGR